MKKTNLLKFLMGLHEMLLVPLVPIEHFVASTHESVSTSVDVWFVWNHKPFRTNPL